MSNKSREKISIIAVMIIMLFMMTGFLFLAFNNALVEDINENNTNEYFATIKNFEKKDGDYIISLNEYPTKILVEAEMINITSFESLLQENNKISFRLKNGIEQFLYNSNIKHCSAETLKIEDTEIISFEDINEYYKKESKIVRILPLFAAGAFFVIFIILLARFIMILKTSKQLTGESLLEKAQKFENLMIEYEISVKDYKKAISTLLFQRLSWLFALAVFAGVYGVVTLLVGFFVDKEALSYALPALILTVCLISICLIAIIPNRVRAMTPYKNEAQEYKIKYAIDVSDAKKFKIATMIGNVYVVNYSAVKKVVDLKNTFAIIANDNLNVLVVKNEDSMSFYQKLQHELEKNKTRKIKL